jgi:hypothetical protein
MPNVKAYGVLMVTVPISSMVGLVGQVDYRRAFFSQSENEVRFLFGVRLNPR